MSVAVMLLQLGGSDCETLQSSGFLAQPVNAWTSLAYSLVGLWMIAKGGGSGWLSRRALGWILVAVGLGSFAFHGPQPVGARWMHDFPIALALVFVVLSSISRIDIVPPRPVLLVGAAVAIVIGVILAVSPDTGIVLIAPVAMVLVGVEAWKYRVAHHGRPEAKSVVIRYVAVALILGFGGLLQLLGSTDGPLCDPGGLFQLHGLWHIVTALAFGVWSTIAFGDPGDPRRWLDRDGYQ